MTAHILWGTALGLVLSTGAFAQSYTAPAGIPAVTAPGGLEGRAAGPNLAADQGRSLQGYGGRGIVRGGFADDGLTTGSVRADRRGRHLDGR
ncbi:hypothetical protein [Methylobacterium planeticum]|uniref:Uncharacterized protein n=1 Tax=Methylobacterium planeticum TaxID=2615211 RepID=A0A6N6MPI9_9HYPH|nr:hypothetical protein [Methylobacterium planeticum]KAB1072426.1 hypothetical protein F6X51_15640 [Methylobacterium planeticum]